MIPAAITTLEILKHLVGNVDLVVATTTLILLDQETVI